MSVKITQRKASTCIILAVSVLLVLTVAVESQGRRARSRGGGIVSEGAGAASEAPTGYDNETNGLVEQAIHDQNRDVFDEVEGVADGLGPVFNAQSCRACHLNPVSGAGSQITELRVAYSGEQRIERRRRHLGRGRERRRREFAIGLGDDYADPDILINYGRDTIFGRSLINDHAVCPNGNFPDLSAQMTAPEDATVRSERMSLSILGDGFVEAIPDEAIKRVALEQCAAGDGICGRVNMVPILEAPDLKEVGRFGWKAQHASLLSFAADAYLNEMGITSPLLPEDVTVVCDEIDDPEDDGVDVAILAEFMRATKAPPRQQELARQPDVQVGSEIFDQIGCAICHVKTFVTAPAGSIIHGGMFEVPEALGNKIIHPYGDFLLHDVGTGDGIIQGDPSTENRLRTPPLWGLHVRPRLMHDGASATVSDAIKRHGGEAKPATRRFFDLSSEEREKVILFLRSL
jgi:CxxC motif-containing protein (DUF1111 family)